MNEGNVTFRIFGLTLQGEFNATRTWETMGKMGGMMRDIIVERVHPGTIPFKANGSSLIPFFGTDDEGMEISSLTLEPGQNATLSFSGVITLQPDMGMVKGPAMVVTPIVGDTYTVRLMGEGFQTFNVSTTP